MSEMVNEVVQRLAVIPSQQPEYANWSVEPLMSWFNMAMHQLQQANGGKIPHYENPLPPTFDVPPEQMRVILMRSLPNRQRNAGEDEIQINGPQLQITLPLDDP